jgi:hypothetical protein
MTVLLDGDAALAYILRNLRERGPATHGQHGYHFTVVDLAARYVAEVLGRRHADRVENADTYAASTPFYDAAWELARRGIVRPSVNNSFMQFDAHQSAGGGYTLTAIGAAWLEQQAAEARLTLCAAWGPFADR